MTGTNSLKRNRDNEHFDVIEEDDELDFSNEPTFFTCPACPATFVTRITLSRHMIYHENDPKFTCSFCRLIFFKKDQLADHIANKHGGAKFSCQLCGRNLSRRDHLVQHYKNVHPGNDEILNHSEKSVRNKKF